MTRQPHGFLMDSEMYEKGTAQPKWNKNTSHLLRTAFNRMVFRWLVTNRIVDKSTHLFSSSVFPELRLWDVQVGTGMKVISTGLVYPTPSRSSEIRHYPSVNQYKSDKWWMHAWYMLDLQQNSFAKQPLCDEECAKYEEIGSPCLPVVTRNECFVKGFVRHLLGKLDGRQKKISESSLSWGCWTTLTCSKLLCRTSVHM